MDGNKKHHSFLLRLWTEDVNGLRVWRISLEDPFSGERRGFARLEDLCAYLETKMHEEKMNKEHADEE
jgi:hypothetical protein